MKAWKPLVIALGTALWVQGCAAAAVTSDKNAAPEAAVTRLIESVRTNQAAEAKALFHPNFVAERERDGGFGQFFAAGRARFKEVKEFAMLGCSRSGKSAKYQVRCTGPDDGGAYDMVCLRKIHGTWWITDIHD